MEQRIANMNVIPKFSAPFRQTKKNAVQKYKKCPIEYKNFCPQPAVAAFSLSPIFYTHATFHFNELRCINKNECYYLLAVLRTSLTKNNRPFDCSLRADKRTWNGIVYGKNNCTEQTLRPMDRFIHKQTYGQTVFSEYGAQGVFSAHILKHIFNSWSMLRSVIDSDVL